MFRMTRSLIVMSSGADYVVTSLALVDFATNAAKASTLPSGEIPRCWSAVRRFIAAISHVAPRAVAISTSSINNVAV